MSAPAGPCTPEELERLLERLRESRRRGRPAALTPEDRRLLTGAVAAMRSAGLASGEIASALRIKPDALQRLDAAARASDAVDAETAARWEAWARARIARRAKTTGTIVSGRGVVKRWGAVTALDEATFRISTGVTGLLGANGAGKTTLLGAVLGLHRVDAGSLEVAGLDPWTAGPEVRARLGYAPEHDALPPDVQAADFVRHMAEIHGIPHREATGRASDVLYLVGLGEERFRALGTMSTGQRQRVKLAQAIVHDPVLVLLDEPTNGLDPGQRDGMLHLIRRIGSELGINVILSSHLIDEVERVCDAVTILASGRVVAEGRLDELRAAGDDLIVEVDGSAEDFVAALASLGEEATVDGLRVVVPVSDEATVDRVRDAAVAADVGLRRMVRRSATLHDVYLGTGS